MVINNNKIKFAYPSAVVCVALMLALSFAYSVSTLSQKLSTPFMHREGNVSMQSEILIAIRLAGNDLLHQPITVRASKQTNGDTIVTFAHLLSDTMASPGRKPTKDVLHITFKHDEVKMEPASFFLKEKQESSDNLMLCHVAILSCSYMLKYKELGNEFELEINKSGTNYNVTATRIPYTPDSYVTVKVSEKAGKLKLVQK